MATEVTAMPESGPVLGDLDLSGPFGEGRIKCALYVWDPCEDSMTLSMRRYLAERQAQLSMTDPAYRRRQLGP